jgi:sugar O-acyltransferase (sialic acid O-acetyltransferase NeuD family)
LEKPIVFWGSTGQAKVLKECLAGSGFQLIALFDNNPEIKSPFPDVPLYCGKESFQYWLVSQRTIPIYFLVAIGGFKGKERVGIQLYLRKHGLLPHTAIHRTAYVAPSALIMEGTQILANAAVCVDVQLGQACIINTGATVDHECRLGEGIHLCPGAHIAGCVEIESYASVGTGAVILPRLKIGKGAVVGAGAVVTKDVPSYTVVAGNPAKLLKELPGDAAFFLE